MLIEKFNEATSVTTLNESIRLALCTPTEVHNDVSIGNIKNENHKIAKKATQRRALHEINVQQGHNIVS